MHPTASKSGKLFHEYRFHIFLFSLLLIIFGSIIFPPNIYKSFLSPFFFFTNVAAGLVLVRNYKKTTAMLIFLITIVPLLNVFNNHVLHEEYKIILLFELVLLFVYYVIVSYHLIYQVWRTKEVDIKTVLGLISGYISLGLLAFMAFSIIELSIPNAFTGLHPDAYGYDRGNLMYFSFVTLLTIGYGDIYPLADIAKRVSILVGLIGQIYMVVITAVVIEKYIRHSKKKEEE